MNQKKLYFDNHSKETAKIIYENFTKESGLFVSCIYENGVKYIKQPSEPLVTKSGLARQHLKSGYESLWEFYGAGRDESIEKCQEIEGTINKYEETIFAEIERHTDKYRKAEIRKEDDRSFCPRCQKRLYVLSRQF